jgi:hypothetical protein
MTPCPWPAKTPYRSKRAAKRAIALITRCRANGGPGRLHAYQCGDHWHVGHTTY